MLDMKFLRENPELVKENMKKKFQDNKLELVDKVILLDKEVVKEGTPDEVFHSLFFLALCSMRIILEIDYNLKYLNLNYNILEYYYILL